MSETTEALLGPSQASHSSPHKKNAATAEAEPLAVAGGRTGCGLGGNCHSLRSAETKTCQTRKAIMTPKKARVPFGYLSAAQASNVQPRTPPIVLNQLFTVIHA